MKVLPYKDILLRLRKKARSRQTAGCQSTQAFSSHRRDSAPADPSFREVPFVD